MKFPLFIDIEGKNVLVVGGGNIGMRRAKILADFGANVTVVSETIKNINDNNINYINRKFEDSDIDNSFIVVAATNDRQVNHRIYQLCKNKNIFVSVADCYEESTFYFPALCLNEDLCVGVVSDGTHHSLVKATAKRIRGEILCKK